MSLSDQEVEHWAAYLADAIDRRSEVAAITKSMDLSLDDAYRIQAAGVAARLAGGEAIIGAKTGLTSKAKQVQMGVSEPIFGVLTNTMMLNSEELLQLDTLVHARCEPEIVFRLAEDLKGPNITAGDVLDATATVHGGIEIIDSRYEKFSFTLPDVIADNTSAARFTIGSTGVAPRDVDLTVLGCVFKHNGNLAATATGAALLGDPAICVAMLANHLATRDQYLSGGSIILAGALSDAVALSPGDFAVASYASLGEVRIVAA